MINVLHITNWYPNHWNWHEAPFIREHFRAVSQKVQSQLWHVQVRSEGNSFRLHSGASSTSERFLLLDTGIGTWRILELLNLLLLVFLRIRLGRKWWDLVNVHIAYPLLRFPGIFKFLFGKNVVITEHWSAYHQNFYLPDGSSAKRRIQRIFHHQIPVVTVSRALMDDVVRFAGTADFQQHIVPNVVDPAIFHPRPRTLKNEKELVFLMVGNWATIKRPLLAMEAFAKFSSKYPAARLRIVGYGHQWADMQTFVREYHLEDKIVFLGVMQKEAIADEMRKADIFLHASNYETFSVVCAEALCCGLPVVASNVGGISEFVNESNGILVKNTTEDWATALCDCVDRLKFWDREVLSLYAVGLFNPEVVGKKLVAVYTQQQQRSSL